MTYLNNTDYSGHMDEIEKTLVSFADSLVVDMGLVNSLPVTSSVSHLIAEVAENASKCDKFLTWIRSNRKWATRCLETFLVTRNSEHISRYSMKLEEMFLFYELYGDTTEHL